MMWTRALTFNLVYVTRSCKKTMCSAAAATEKFAYVNHDSEKSRLRLTFKYASGDIKERLYTLNRASVEELRVVLARISLNITNNEEGKTKRKRKKQENSRSDEDAAKTESHPKLLVSLEHNGIPVPEDLTSGDAWKDGSILQIGDQRYSVLVNAPSVRCARLPKLIMAGFPVYAYAELDDCSLNDCDFAWYRSVDRGQSYPRRQLYSAANMLFVFVQNGPWMTPTYQDIGHHLLLLLTPQKLGVQGMTVEVLSNTAIQPGPMNCPFQNRQYFTSQFSGFRRFRCVSYNLLAGVYAESQLARETLYPYCARYALKMDYRKNLIMKELFGYRSDLFFLQEVDRKFFREDLEVALGFCGFAGYYTEKNSPMAEGLACFYRKNKFRSIESHSMILSNALEVQPALADILAKVNKNPRVKERLMTLPTAFQALLLQPMDKQDRLLLVANTHLYYHPEGDHIRLLQAYMCIRLVEQLLSEYSHRFGVKPAVVFAGDFNSCPRYGVYQLMTYGYVSEHCPDWYTKVEEGVLGMHAMQKIPLASACGLPDYTNFTLQFQGCLDYIFFDYSQLVWEKAVPMPAHEQVVQEVALPSTQFPSDHVAQVATLRWL